MSWNELVFHTVYRHFKAHINETFSKRLYTLTGPAEGTKATADTILRTKSFHVCEHFCHFRQNAVVVCRRTEHNCGCTTKFCHNCAMVIRFQVHNAYWYAFAFKAFCNSVRHFFSRMPHGIVYNNCTFFPCLLCKFTVLIKAPLNVFFTTENKAMVRSKHINLNTHFCNSIKSFENQRRKRKNNVLVVFNHVVFNNSAVYFIHKTFGAGNVLSENVVADKKLVLRDVGHHGIRPVKHTSFNKLDVT